MSEDAKVVLVVANETLAGDELVDAVRARAEFVALARLFKRVNNIVEEKIGDHDGAGMAGLGRDRLHEPAERDLRADLDQIAPQVTTLTASGVNWIAVDPPVSWMPVTAQIRHRHRPGAARVLAVDDARAELTFDEPQTAITPGQAVVFYDGDVVVGGGWID